MSLKSLISKFKEEDNKFKKYVKYENLFLNSLNELDTIIGNDDVKDMIAKQIMVYLAQQYQGIETDKTMLNIIFSGSPGVGKTMIAGKVAKILYSLGLVKAKKKPAGIALREMIRENKNSSDYLTFIYIFLIFGIICFSVMMYTWKFLVGLGLFYSLILVTVFLFFVFFSIYYINSCWYSIPNEEPEPKSNVKEETPQTIKDIDESLIFSVVTRTDFIDRYVGGTEKKTKALLMDNIGKVLFIDEAYSIARYSHDQFGLEALDQLNLFLSQHPNEIIVIMAGYKELLEQTVFTYQPGLRRRFMWTFDCKGYTSQELFQIYELQLKKQGYKVFEDDRNLIMKLFSENYDEFKNFGGDTERLTNYSKLDHSQKIFETGDKTFSNILKYEDVKTGIDKLKTFITQEPKSKNETDTLIEKLFGNKESQNL